MSERSPLSRSPHLMSRNDTALLIVDVQTKLMRLIPGHERIVWNLRRLLDAAEMFSIPVLATEQYPQGIGPTIEEIAPRLPRVATKCRFSCGACPDLFEHLPDEGRTKILVAGIEAHVCIQQTALDLLASGFSVFIPVDGIGSRYELDRDVAVRRMETAGCMLTTTESALFEWCEDSSSPEFKRISGLIREAPPVCRDNDAKI